MGHCLIKNNITNEILFDGKMGSTPILKVDDLMSQCYFRGENIELTIKVQMDSTMD